MYIALAHFAGISAEDIRTSLNNIVVIHQMSEAGSTEKVSTPHGGPSPGAGPSVHNMSPSEENALLCGHYYRGGAGLVAGCPHCEECRALKNYESMKMKASLATRQLENLGDRPSANHLQPK